MNNTASNVTPVNAMLEAYIRAGFALVPILQGKGPVGKGWNEKKNCITTIEQINPSIGYGLAHAYSNTMALDVDDWAQAVAALAPMGIDLNALAAAPDSVMIDSGNPGHAKFLFRLPVCLPSKKLIINGQTIYELRSATASGLTVQDVLPSAAMHPKTHQQYRWAGNGHFNDIPVIPDALLTLWESMVEADKARNIDMGETIDASWEDIQSAVECIPADCSRDEWIRVGMALHYAGSVTNQLDQALYIWNDWSKQSEAKYPGERGIYNQWVSFKTDKASSAKLGTLFHFAKQHGWVRPAIDASEYFKAVSASSPKDLLASLNFPPPNPDLDLWPTVLATRAREIASIVACDPLVPLFAGLAAACGVADAESRLELMPGFQVPPVLWLMTIGSPSERKTPGSRPMFTSLSTIELEDRPRFKKEFQNWEGKEAMHAAAKKAFIQFSESPEALLGGQPPLVPDLPPQPVPLKIVVSDITSQKLVRHAADRPRGLLCVLDEMNGWVRKLSDPRSGEDRSSWVEAYEAGRYEMDRVGAGTISADNFAVSIYGNIQPRVFRENITFLTADGLLQRFIPAILRKQPKGKIGDPIPDYMTTATQWEQALRTIYSLPKQTYTLRPEGFAMFRDFQSWASQTRHDDDLLQTPDDLMTALGKLEGTAGRFIFLFHLLENPFDRTVSADTVERALRMVKGYVVPALRYALAELGGISSFDTWVVNHVLHYADKTSLTLSDIKRSARRQLEKVSPYVADQMVLSAMIPLERAQWVCRIDDGSGERAHHAEWVINPALAQQFARQRREVIEAKQRRLDEIYANNPKDTEHRVYGIDD